MQLSAAGQYSPNSLLASEEFSVGGPDFGRAYDAGEISGDRGIAGAVELRYNVEPFHDLVRSTQIYGYYDAGQIWNEDVVVGEFASSSVASAGIGVRFNFASDIYAYMELDAPLTREVNAENSKDPRLFFNVLKRF